MTSPRVQQAILLFALLGLSFCAVHGQTTPQLPEHPVPQQVAPAPALSCAPQETPEQCKARQRAEGDREVDQQEQQRILAVVPNFNTVISGRGVPLTPGQKTRLAVRATFDPFNYASSFLLAGLSEYEGTNRGFGWGPGGYFKRVGANFADIVDSTMLAGAVYPILLHQDPRFFRQGTGTIKSRVKHALVAPFVCLGDNQKKQPNYSNLLGNLTAGAISNVYYPNRSEGVGLTFENFGITTVEGSLGNIGLEFAPDVANWWHKRKQRKLSPVAPATP